MPRPIFLLILNPLYKGFQMRYHLFQRLFGKMVRIKEMSFLSTRGMILMFGNCIPLTQRASRIFKIGFTLLKRVLMY